MIGKNAPDFSNHWKKAARDFQSLENRPLVRRQPDPYALDVRITPSSDAVRPGDPLTATIAVRHADGSPAAARRADWAACEHRTWDGVSQAVTTGPAGTARVDIGTADRLGVMTISAGVDVNEGPYRRRFGDLAVVRVGME